MRWILVLALSVMGSLAHPGSVHYNLMTEKDKELLTFIQSDRKFRAGQTCQYDENLAKEAEGMPGFRTFHGGFNNDMNKVLGFIGTPLVTLVPRSFDGANDIRKSAAGNEELKSARVISNALFKKGESTMECPRATDLLTQVVQFLEHDLMRTVFKPDPVGTTKPNCCANGVPSALDEDCCINGIPEGESNCCTKEVSPVDCCANGLPVNNDLCASIPVSMDDPELTHASSPNDKTCIRIKRLVTGDTIDCKRKLNEVLNFNTDYPDLDIVYREDFHTGVDGLMSTTEYCYDMTTRNLVDCTTAADFIKREFLPKCAEGEDGCTTCTTRAEANNKNIFTEDDDKCCLSNEHRVTVTPMQTFIHTVFHNLHNKIATELKSTWGSMSSDELFQLARKWNIAFWQNIIYGELLPIIIGVDLMKEYRLFPKSENYMGYDSGVDPRISHLSNIALRFGHSMMKTNLKLMKDIGSQSQGDQILKIVELFGQCWKIEDTADTTAEMYRGLLVSAAACSNSATETMKPTSTSKNVGFVDMIATDIQRSREIGVASYNRARQFCRTSTWGGVANFDDLIPDIGERNVRKLKSLYQSVHDIDLPVGAILEKPIEGAIVGRTFGGILADQFKRLKIGDRFYFENAEQFRTEELNRIHDVTFSHLICWTLDIEEVAKNSFLADGEKVKCSDLPTLMEVVTPAIG